MRLNYYLNLGTGTMLGDMPRVVYFMDKKDHEETLGVLQRIIYGGKSVGKKNEKKKNLKKFNGFPFDADSAEYEKRFEHANKIFTVAQLKKVCELLDMERGGTKPDLMERVFKFLLSPHKSNIEGLPQSSKRKSKKKKTSSSLNASKTLKECGLNS